MEKRSLTWLLLSFGERSEGFGAAVACPAEMGSRSWITSRRDGSDCGSGY